MRKWVGKDLSDLNTFTSNVLVCKSELGLLTPRPFLVLWPKHLTAQSQGCDLKMMCLMDSKQQVESRVNGNVGCVVGGYWVHLEGLLLGSCGIVLGWAGEQDSYWTLLGASNNPPWGVSRVERRLLKSLEKQESCERQNLQCFMQVVCREENCVPTWC